MLTKWLMTFSHPSNRRDIRTVDKVAKSLHLPMVLSIGFALVTYVLREHSVLLFLPLLISIGALLYIGFTLKMLHREMYLRAFYRSKRLALPASLAEGIAAGERENVVKVAEVITLRLRDVRDFNGQTVRVFDCLMHDILESSPDFALRLKDLAAKRIIA